MMENIETIEEMRAQMNLLKEKLDSQTILNEKVVRNSYRRSLTDLRKKNLISVVLGVAAILLSVSYIQIGFSIYFVIFTDVMLLGIIIYTLVLGNRLPSPSENLLDSAKKVAKFKMAYVDWLKIGIPLICVWIGFLFTEVIISDMADEAKLYFCIGAVAGIVLGLFLGLRIRRSTIESAEELLRQVKDLQSLDE